MAEALLQMYNIMSMTAWKELYDFMIITCDSIIPKYNVKTIW